VVPAALADVAADLSPGAMIEGEVAADEEGT